MPALSSILDRAGIKPATEIASEPVKPGPEADSLEAQLLSLDSSVGRSEAFSFPEQKPGFLQSMGTQAFGSAGAGALAIPQRIAEGMNWLAEKTGIPHEQLSQAIQSTETYRKAYIPALQKWARLPDDNFFNELANELALTGGGIAGAMPGFVAMTPLATATEAAAVARGAGTFLGRTAGTAAQFGAAEAAGAEPGTTLETGLGGLGMGAAFGAISKIPGVKTRIATLAGLGAEETIRQNPEASPAQVTAGALAYPAFELLPHEKPNVAPIFAKEIKGLLKNKPEDLHPQTKLLDEALVKLEEPEAASAISTEVQPPTEGAVAGATPEATPSSFDAFVKARGFNPVRLAQVPESQNAQALRAEFEAQQPVTPSAPIEATLAKAETPVEAKPSLAEGLSLEDQALLKNLDPQARFSLLAFHEAANDVLAQRQGKTLDEWFALHPQKLQDVARIGKSLKNSFFQTQEPYRVGDHAFSNEGVTRPGFRIVGPEGYEGRIYLSKEEALLDAAQRNAKTSQQGSLPFSENFKAWFGDWEKAPASASKIIDETGTPLVVYHGSPERGITAFDPEKIGSTTDSGWFGRGFYFTADKGVARSWAGSSGGFYQTYLNIKNPFVFAGGTFGSGNNIKFSAQISKAVWQSDLPTSEKVALLKELTPRKYAEPTEEDIIGDPGEVHLAAKTEEERARFSAAATKVLKALGYDGVVVNRRHLVPVTEGLFKGLADTLSETPSKFDEVVAFEPTQIKSVKNKGGFDPNEANIYLQRNAEGKILGVTQFTGKDLNRVLFKLTKSANVSTLLHEWAHSYLHLMDPELRRTLDPWLGKENTTEAHEKFARSFEKYIHDGGLAESPVVQSTFDRLGAFMRAVYRKVTGSAIDLKLAPEFHEVMGKLLNFETPEERTARVKEDLYGLIHSPEKERTGMRTFVSWIFPKTTALRGTVAPLDAKQSSQRYSFDLGYALLIANAKAEEAGRQINFVPNAAQNVRLTKAIKLIEEGKISEVSSMLSDDPHLFELLRRLRQNYDAMRGDIQQGIRDDVYDRYSEHRDEIDRVLAGEPIEEIFPPPVNKSGELARGGKISKKLQRMRDDIEEAAKAIKESETWGKDNFFTHAQLGGSRIVRRSDGVTIAAGATDKQAALRAVSWLENFREENPKEQLPELIYDVPQFDSSKTYLSRRGYYAMEGRLAKAAGASRDAIDAALRSQGFRVKLELRRPSSRFLEKRHDVTLPIESPVDAQFQELHSVYRMLELKKVWRDLEKDLPKFKPEERKILLEQYEFARSHYSWEDKVFDKIAEYVGWDLPPGRVSAVTGAVRQALAFDLVLSRPIASAVNVVFGTAHPFIEYGAKAIVRGIKFARTEEGRQFEVNSEFLLPRSSFSTLLGDYKTRNKWGQVVMKYYFPARWFGAAERTIHRLGLAVNYTWAKDHPELAFPEAKGRTIGEDSYVAFARDATRTQAFLYDVASLGVAWRGPLGKTIGLFKQYPIQELSFLHKISHNPAALARYVGVLLAVGGPKALVTTAASFTALAGMPFLDELNKWLEENMPRASRGLPGYLGMDISGPASFRVPVTLEDWAGPMLSIATDIGKYVENGFQKADLESFVDSHAPMVYSLKQALRNVNFQSLSLVDDPIIKDTRGNMLMHASGLDLLKELGGITPLEASHQRTIAAIAFRYAKENAQQRNNLSRAIVRGLLSNSDVSDSLLDYANVGGDRASLLREFKAQKLTPEERLLVNSRIQTKLYMLPALRLGIEAPEMPVQPGAVP